MDYIQPATYHDLETLVHRYHGKICGKLFLFIIPDIAIIVCSALLYTEYLGSR